MAENKPKDDTLPTNAELLAKLKRSRFSVSAYGETFWQDAFTELEKRFQAEASPAATQSGGALDQEMLEACAKLIRDLDEGGPTQSRRNRIKLLADWQRSRATPPKGDTDG